MKKEIEECKPISIAEELSMAKQRNQELREELELARIENDNRRMVNEIKRLNKEYTPLEEIFTYTDVTNDLVNRGTYTGRYIPCNSDFNPY